MARIDPVKDQGTFLAAASQFAADPSIRFVWVGDGIPGAMEGLRADIAGAGLAGKVAAVGPELDMPGAYRALDLLVSSSRIEGLSNVIVEAMAVGVPCVVTDTGDSAEIVGDVGAVVPVGDAPAMAAAIRDMLERLGPELSAAVRARAVERFGRERLVRDTAALLTSLIRG